jgi:hypothetical protein
MICAACLELKSVKPVQVEKVRSFPFAAILQCLVATAVILLVFYFFAQTLGDIPDDFHDGTIWE